MSTVTSNYKFIKPDLTDAADITATNDNWDKIDEKLHDAMNGDIDGVIGFSSGGHGGTTRPQALQNLSGLDSLGGNSPSAMPLIYANMSDTGVVANACTTKEYCAAMKNYQAVMFVHNVENSIKLTDAPSNYGVCMLFRGYNENYLVGQYIGVNGEMYKFKSHTTNTLNDGWTLVGNKDGVKAATVE